MESIDISTGADVAVASGRNFLTLLDKQSGRLLRFTRDGSTWKAEPEAQLDAPNAVLALTARENFIVTASATADNSRAPEIRLYYLDEMMIWRVTSQVSTQHFFDSKDHKWKAKVQETDWWWPTSKGIRAIDLYAGNTFVLLRAAARVSRLDGATEEEYDVYRHFIYRWSEDLTKIELDFEPCLDISKKGAIWDCIKQHNTEIVLKKDKGTVRSSVVGDQVVIDVWENILAVEIGTAKQKKFVYRYSGQGWHESNPPFNNDQLQNNYLGSDSFSTTADGRARHWEFHPDTAGWQESNMPTYRDGNPGLFQKTIWPLIQLVGSAVALPFDWGPGLLVEVVLLNLDMVISSMTRLGGGALGSEEFFIADFSKRDDYQSNFVYHKGSSGPWQAVDYLAPETYMNQNTGETLPSISGIPGLGQKVYEDLKLDLYSTQHLENAIIYTLDHDRYGKNTNLPLLEQGHGTLPGYPKYNSKVQLLKNGAFLKSIALDGELVRYGPDDTCPLSSHNSFVSFKGGNTLKEADTLRLHRVVNDDIRDCLTDFVVSQVVVNDGYGDIHTHYDYDAANASALPTGSGALYSKVTTTYSGASPSSDNRNGHSESYFHGNEAFLCAGLLYRTKIFNPAGSEIATNTARWQVFKRRLTPDGTERKRTGYFVRAIATSSSLDGVTKRSEIEYCTADALPFALVKGAALPVVISGWVEIKGAEGWSVDANQRLAYSSRGVSSTGVEPWQPAIGPLTFDCNFFGSLQFDYDLSTDIYARGTASFEARVDDVPIWNDERMIIKGSGGFTGRAVLGIRFDDRPVELRVRCRLYGSATDVKFAIYNLAARTTAVDSPLEVRT
ncbi:MAG TPA: hypothetical protein VI756_03070, partial [Blastocatellia bacterium]